jgi:hypothetical protein
MKVRALVESIQDDIDQCEKKLVPPHTSQPRYWYNLDAQLMITQLRAKLKELEACGPDTVVTPDYVKPLVALFDEFWERRQLTDAIFNIDTTSPENELCIRIADYLRSKKLVAADHAMQILMPTVKPYGWVGGIYNVQLSRLPLHAYFPSQNGEVCYLITSLDPHYNLKTSEVEMIANVNGNNVPVAKDDCERLRNHSDVALRFIDLCFEFQKAKQHDPKMKLPKELQDAQQAFKAALNNPDKLLVKSTYGKEGLERLKSGVLKKRNMLFKNREQLFDYMSVYCKPESWPSFFKNQDQEMIDFKVLLELILKIDSAELLTDNLTERDKVYLLQGKIDAVLNDGSLFANGAKYAAVVLYSLLDLYRQQREKAGKYTGYFTPLFSLLSSNVFPQQIKDEGMVIMQKYLTASDESKMEYAKYFTPNAASENPSGFTVNELYVLAAMKEKNSTSSKLYTNICKFVPAPVQAQKNELAL